MSTSNVLATINDALVLGYDGLVLSDGSQLTADRKPDNISSVSDDVLPFLLFDVGNMTFQPWTAWEESIAWDVPAVLKLKGEAGDVDGAMLDAIRDLLAQTKRLIGLPVDEDGKVTPYGPTTRRLFEAGKLSFLAERGAPFIKAIQVQPSDGSYITATITFHIETTIDLDPRGPLPLATVVTLGVNSSRGSVAQDTTMDDPLGIAVVSSTDEHSWGGYNTIDPFNPNRSKTHVSTVAGPPLNSQLRSLNVTPYAATTSTTQQLQAIATFQDWSSRYVTQVVSWASGDVNKATVDANGLVTKVAAGAVVITATYGGASASSSITVT